MLNIPKTFSVWKLGAGVSCVGIAVFSRDIIYLTYALLGLSAYLIFLEIIHYLRDSNDSDAGSVWCYRCGRDIRVPRVVTQLRYSMQIICDKCRDGERTQSVKQAKIAANRGRRLYDVDEYSPTNRLKNYFENS